MEPKIKNKKEARRRRIKMRISKKYFGTANRPRLCVYRSDKEIYAQLIDDEKGKTLVSVKDVEIKKKNKKTELAFEVGKLIAKKAIEKKIEKIVFDRAGYQYHGRVKSLADGAREGGLKF